MMISLRTLREQYLPDISSRWLYTLVRRGDLPATRIGSKWLCDPVEVIEAIKRKRVGALEVRGCANGNREAR